MRIVHSGRIVRRRSVTIVRAATTSASRLSASAVLNGIPLRAASVRMHRVNCASSIAPNGLSLKSVVSVRSAPSIAAAMADAWSATTTGQLFAMSVRITASSAARVRRSARAISVANEDREARNPESRTAIAAPDRSQAAAAPPGLIVHNAKLNGLPHGCRVFEGPLRRMRQPFSCVRDEYGRAVRRMRASALWLSSLCA